MDLLKNFFMLRWKLAPWVIPLVWTVFVLHRLSTYGGLIYETWRNFGFPPMAARWQDIQIFLPALLWGTIYSFSVQIIDVAIVGVFLFAAQHVLFERKP